MSGHIDRGCHDRREEDPGYYSASATPEVVTIGPVQVLAIEGLGAPGGGRHRAAIGALYAVAEGVRGVAEQARVMFAIPPLEGLWWVDDDRPPLEVPSDEWRWKPLLRVPDAVAPDRIERAIAGAGDDPARPVRLETLAEGRCAQVLHRGPYDEEPETLAALAEFMVGEGLVMNGRHHEIYLTGPAGPPEQTLTILRHPVRFAGD